MACYHFTIKADKTKDGTRISASEHTDYIERNGKYENIDDKNLPLTNNHANNVNPASHADYINRDEAYAYKGGCIGKGHHLPKWADNSPKAFFEAANKYESKTGCRYKEIEFALPNELNINQQQEIINQFLNNHLKDFYYAYAIHDKIGTMSNGERNTHVHIMFSERKLDDIELAKERTPEEFFSRSTTLPDGTKRGGAAKDPKWNGSDRSKYLCKMRRDFAMLQNNALEKAGFAIRVDHRSLKEQRAAALANGDLKLAKLLDRLPERHLGPDITAQKSHPAVKELQKYRSFKKEYQQLLYAADLLENNIEKQESSIQEDANLRSTKKLLTVAKQQNNLSSNVVNLKNMAISTLREINALKAVVIWHDEAFKLAKEKFMTDKELYSYGQFKMLQKEKNEIMALQKTLPKPQAWHPEDKSAYAALNQELTIRLTTVQDKLNATLSEVRYTNKRLTEYKKQIEKEAIAILSNNKINKVLLKQRNDKLAQIIGELQAEILLNTEAKLSHAADNQNLFTAKEISAVLQSVAENLKSETYKIKRTMDKLAPKVIFLNRAGEMAKNIYVNGEFKQLRENHALLKKERSRIDHAAIEYEDAKKSFAAIKPPKWYQDKSAYKQEEAKLLTMKNILDNREATYIAKIQELEQKQSELETRCQSPAALDKIKAITLGILEKNKPIADKYKSLSLKHKALIAKSQKVNNLLKASKKQLSHDNNNSRYSLNPSSSRGSAFSSLPKAAQAYSIAKAFSGDARMVGMIAYTQKDTAELKFEESAKSKIDREIENDLRAE